MSDYTPTTEQVRLEYTGDKPDCKCCTNCVEEAGAEFDRWHAQEIRKAERRGKRTGWSEGYEQGKEDERLAETLQVDVGLGGYAPANRSNPYTEEL